MRTYNLTDPEKKACKAIADALEYNGYGVDYFEANEIAGVDKAGDYDFDLCLDNDIKWDGTQKLEDVLASLDAKHVIQCGQVFCGHTSILGIYEAVKALTA